MSPRITIIYSDFFAKHHIPPWPHPETPERVIIAYEAVAGHGGWNIVEELGRCGEDELSNIHHPGYIAYVKRLTENAPAEIDPDTYVSRDTYDAALTAFCTAADAAEKAFMEKDAYIVLLRPPGHHAGRGGKAMGAPTQGFCIFNNAAAAAERMRSLGAERVAIIDFDIHHGNGTQEIFYRDDKVLHIDIHRWPGDFYPGTGWPGDIGAGRGRGYSINFSIPRGAGDDVYLEIIDTVYRLLEEYGASGLVYSMGFDGYLGDGLADTALSEKTYCMLGEIAHRLAVPAAAVLEGGYGEGLRKGLPAFLHGLSGRGCGSYRTRRSGRHVVEAARRWMRETLNAIRPYWGGLP